MINGLFSGKATGDTFLLSIGCTVSPASSVLVPTAAAPAVTIAFLKKSLLSIKYLSV
jgi:hypothetical protein